MASFTVIRKIGAAGGLPYSTLAGWQADAPVDCTTAEKSAAGTFLTATFIHNESLTFVGSGATGKFLDTDSTAPGNGTYIAYGITTGNPAASDVVTGGSSGATCVLSSGTPTNVGCIWQGQINAASDSFTGTTTRLTISGSTDSMTAYVELTTATGASFRDNASVQSNALRYNTANGCTITNSGNAYQPCIDNRQLNTRLSNLQVYQSGGARALVLGGGTDAAMIVRDCILETSGDYVYLTATRNANVFINVLFCNRTSGAAGIVYPASSNTTTSFINCTFVVPSDKTAATNCFDCVAYTIVTTKNCAMFGVGAIKNNGAFTHTGGYSNLSGTTGVTQVTYNTTAFTNITDATRDFRTTTSGSLVAKVTADTTNAPNDIVGTVRPTGANASDVGTWQTAVVAASSNVAYSAVFGA